MSEDTDGDLILFSGLLAAQVSRIRQLVAMPGPGMDSDVDNELSNCASDSEVERPAARNHRQQRLTDMALHNQAQRRSKRSHQALERGPGTPGDVISPEAKRPTSDPDPDGGGQGWS